MSKKKITIEDLAIMVQKGFSEASKKADVDKRFEQVDKKFEKIETQLEHIDNRLYNIEKDVSEIKKNFVSRYEFEDLLDRVKNLEKKIGVKSRK